MIQPVVRPGVIPSVYPLEVPKGCILYLDMQDRGATVLDHSRLRNHGTVSGALVAGAPRGVCRSFDGVDDVITITGDKLGTGALTIEAWIRPASAGEANAGKIVCNPSSADVAALYMAANRFGFTSDNATFVLAAGGCIPAYDVWHQVAVSRAADATASLYINGALTGLADRASGTPAAGGDTLIGCGLAGATAFAGLIAMVRIYSRALGAVEVANAYQEHAWRFGRG